VLAAVLVLFFGSVAGSTPGELRKGALDPKPPTDPPVLAVGAGTVSLARDPTSPGDLTTEGVWGVQSTGSRSPPTLGPPSASPSERRCACSGWWPTRGSRRWCSVP
jgi:hypothetical protein